MLSVVIPVYNSAATLDLLATRLDGALDTADEVVLVDDGSADSSWRELSRIVATRPRWKALRLGRNSGQHSALLAGIRVATGDVLVTMDDDLQHPPEEIGVLVGALTEDADLVYGIAKVEEHGRARSFSSRLVKRLMRRSLGVAEADHISAFRCFRTQLRDAFDTVNDPFVSVDVLLSWGTSRVVAAPVDMTQREVGRSNYGLRKLARHTFNMITGYSAAPLHVVAYLGLLLSVLGFVALAYVLVRFLVGQSDVAGFTFLASLLSLIAGSQMLAIAVLGEYLARVHFRAMRKPAYFITETRGDD